MRHPPAPVPFHPLRLFGDITCPFTHRCTLVAAHKRIPVDIVALNKRDLPPWWEETFPRAYRALPLLQIGKTTIQDSKVICQYLDETYPPVNALFPTVPHIRAGVRQFQSACADLISTMYDYLHFHNTDSLAGFQASNFGAKSSNHQSTSPSNSKHSFSSSQHPHPSSPAHHSPFLHSAAHTSLSDYQQQQRNQTPIVSSSSSTTEGITIQPAVAAAPPGSLTALLDQRRQELQNKAAALEAGRKRTRLSRLLVEKHKRGELKEFSPAPFVQPSPQNLDEAVTEEALLEELRAHIRRVEAFIDHSASPFLLGSTPSLGDFTIIPFIDRFRYVFAAHKRLLLMEEAPALARMMHAAELLGSFQRTALPSSRYLKAFEYALPPHLRESEKEENIKHSHGKASSFFNKGPLSSQLELYTQNFDCPWAHAVRITAKLKQQAIRERHLMELDEKSRCLLMLDGLPAVTSCSTSSSSTSSSTSASSSSSSSTSPSTSSSPISNSSCSEDSIVLKHSVSGLRPLKCAVVACHYIIDSFPESGERLICSSLLDSAHEHYILNYMEKHFGPRHHAFTEKAAQRSMLKSMKRAKAAAGKAAENNNQQDGLDEELDADFEEGYQNAKRRLEDSIRVIAREIRGGGIIQTRSREKTQNEKDQKETLEKLEKEREEQEQQEKGDKKKNSKKLEQNSHRKKFAVSCDSICLADIVLHAFFAQGVLSTKDSRSYFKKLLDDELPHVRDCVHAIGNELRHLYAKQTLEKTKRLEKLQKQREAGIADVVHYGFEEEEEEGGKNEKDEEEEGEDGEEKLVDPAVEAEERTETYPE